jgi:ribose transport system permease protein
MSVQTAPMNRPKFSPLDALRRLIQPQNTVFLLLIALIITIAVLNPSFTQPDQFMRFLQRVAPLAIAAIGQYFVSVSGEFDLSMGSVVTAQVVLAGTLVGQDESRTVPVILLMVLFGALIGLVNGLITTLAKVPSFIVTLGMMLALLGAVKFFTGGAASGNPAENFRQIGRGGLRDVPILSYIPWSVLVLAGVLVIAIAISRSPFGRTLVVIGDNTMAARYAGARVWWVKTRAFVISSIAATVSGILLVGFAGVHPSVGQGFEFSAITAVVLGGVVLGGGRGWVVAAAAGAAVLEALFMVMNFASVPSTYRPAVQGVIIIAAVAYAAFIFGGRKRPAVHASPLPPHGIEEESRPAGSGSDSAAPPELIRAKQHTTEGGL